MTGLLRLILMGLLIYLAYKLIKDVLKRSHREPEVKGNPQSKPLNLDKADIVDADFEEIKEERKSREE